MNNSDKMIEILKVIEQRPSKESSPKDFGLTQKEYFDYVSELKEKNLVAGASVNQIREHGYSVRISDAFLTKKGIEFIQKILEE